MQFDQALDQATIQLTGWNQEFGLPAATQDQTLKQLRAGQDLIAFKALGLGVDVLRRLAGQSVADVAELNTQLNQHYRVKDILAKYAGMLGAQVEVPVDQDQKIPLPLFMHQLEANLANKVETYAGNPEFEAFVEPLAQRQDSLYTEAIRQFHAAMQGKSAADFEPLLQDERIRSFPDETQRAHAAVLYASRQSEPFDRALTAYTNFSLFYAAALQEDQGSILVSYATIPTEAADLVTEEIAVLTPETIPGEPEQLM